MVMHLNAGKTNEELRQTYKPSDVRVLLIGESPPANGTFFYLGNSNLWQYTYQAFRNVYGSDLDRGSSFCEFFMSTGCYLEDLCLDAVNRMNKAERKRACEASAALLAKRISLLSPRAVVCVKRSIARQVESAMAKAALHAVSLHELPFPSCGHQQEYVEGLTGLIVRLRASGVML
jgi:hypothetical protein